MIYKTSSLVKFSHTLLPSRMSIISLMTFTLLFSISLTLMFHSFTILCLQRLKLEPYLLIISLQLLPYTEKGFCRAIAAICLTRLEPLDTNYLQIYKISSANQVQVEYTQTTWLQFCNESYKIHSKFSLGPFAPAQVQHLSCSCLVVVLLWCENTIRLWVMAWVRAEQVPPVYHTRWRLQGNTPY